jgi:hypothetical protein
MTNFLETYETVDSRIHKFWQAYPNGRIATEMQYFCNAEGRIVQWLCKASLFRNIEDEVPAATGWAEEIVGSSPVNRTSAAENCETSAIGRAAANMAFSTKGSRPSDIEMNKAKRVEGGVIQGKGGAYVKVETPVVPAAGKSQIEAVVLQTKRFADTVGAPHNARFTLGLLTLFFGKPITDVNTLNIEQTQAFLAESKTGWETLTPLYKEHLTKKAGK